MCQLDQSAIAAMSNAELAAFIREHRAGVRVGVAASDVAASDESYRWAMERARRALAAFVDNEREHKGACDPVRFKDGFEAGFSTLTAETYVLPPEVVEEIALRLKREGDGL